MGWTGYHGGLSLLTIVVTVFVVPLSVHARTRYPANGNVFGYRPFAVRNKQRYELSYTGDLRSPGAELDSHGYYYGDEYQLRRPVKKYRRHKTRRRYGSNQSKYDNYNYEDENDDYQVYPDEVDDVDYRQERPYHPYRYHEDDYDSGPIYGKRRKKYQKPFDDDDDNDDDEDEDNVTDLIRDQQDNKNKDDEDDADNDADYDDADEDNDDDDDVDVEFHSNKNNTNAVTCKYGNVILYVLSSGKRWSCGRPSKGSTVDNEKARSAIALPSLKEDPRPSDGYGKQKDAADYFKIQEQSTVINPKDHRGGIAASSHIKILRAVKLKRDATLK